MTVPVLVVKILHKQEQQCMVLFAFDKKRFQCKIEIRTLVSWACITRYKEDIEIWHILA
jgi:hypothetical protein